MLADLGAEVTKVETPGIGDPFRWSGPAPASPNMAPGFMAVNRGKRSIALDLKAADDLAVMKQLLAEADLFVGDELQLSVARRHWTACYLLSNGSRR